MIRKESYNKQPSAGTVTWNSYSDFRGHSKQIIVNPSIASTTYDFSITNDHGDVIYNKKGNKGTLVDDSEVALYGIVTYSIANASVSTNSYTSTMIWMETV